MRRYNILVTVEVSSYLSVASCLIRVFVFWIHLSIALLITGCATTAEFNDRFAKKHGMQRSEVAVEFPHVIYQKAGQANSDWHIYIEGDGRPWLNGNKISKDPTTVKPLMLRLMSQDTAPSIYLGRPCYNLHETASKCHPYYWTHGRYSEAVVNALTSTVVSLISRNNVKNLTLIGHSGGGTLSMLLAERIPQVKMVVTLAGNLDINAWTDAHGFSRMQSSLNPAQREPLPAKIQQYHYLGKQDKNIRVSMIKHVVKKQGNSQLILLDNYSHSCCWEDDWPVILSQLRIVTNE